MILVDVGLWLAAAWGRHANHPQARAWLDGQESDVAMCRITQMGLLRLLSNPSIMREDVLTRSGSWAVVDQVLRDERISMVDEPQHLETAWRALSAREDTSHRLWPDDYLAAFAQAAGMSIATPDRAFAARYPAIHVDLVG